MAHQLAKVLARLVQTQRAADAERRRRPSERGAQRPAAGGPRLLGERRLDSAVVELVVVVLPARLDVGDAVPLAGRTQRILDLLLLVVVAPEGLDVHVLACVRRRRTQ